MAFRYRVQYRAPYSSDALARHNEVCTWLHENIGKPRITWLFNNTFPIWNLQFRFKKDYTLFLLRWS